MFLVSGLVFRFPLGSPGITRYRSGEISKKAKGLFVLSKMLLFLTLTIPFAGLLMLGFNTVGEIGLSVGEIGLWLTLITVFSFLIPVRPLVGKALFDYRKVRLQKRSFANSPSCIWDPSFQFYLQPSDSCNILSNRSSFSVSGSNRSKSTEKRAPNVKECITSQDREDLRLKV